MWLRSLVVVSVVFLPICSHAEPSQDLNDRLQQLERENVDLKKLRKIEALERENAEIKKQIHSSLPGPIVNRVGQAEKPQLQDDAPTFASSESHFKRAVYDAHAHYID